MDPPQMPPPAVGPSYELQDSPTFGFLSTLSPIATPAQLLKSPNWIPISSIFTSPQVDPRKESKSTIRDVKHSQELNPNFQRNQMGTLENCSSYEDATNTPSKWIRSTLYACETLGDAQKQDIDGKTNHIADVEQDSSIPGFLNDLSPIATPKPLGSTQNAQLFKSSNLPPLSLIFTAPQANPQKESKSAIRNSNDQNGLDQMDSSTSGRNVQENELAKQDTNDLAPCSLNHLVTNCGTGNSVISISDLALEAQQWSNIISSTSILAVDQRNLEDSQRENFVEPFGSYIQSAADDTHVYCAEAAAGVATNHDQEMLPAVIQNQLASNDYNFDTSKVSIDGTAISQQQYGTHRHSLFNGKVVPSNKGVLNISNIHHASICGNNYLKPVNPAVCGIGGLHLNTVANMPLTINPPPLPEQTSLATVISGGEVYTPVDDYSSQKTMPNADKSDKQSHKKRRRKLQNDDGESCRHCSCKKSKCLKLYCACFAAKVYCSKFCSCQGCSNNHTHEEAISNRKKTEFCNPLAFAATVTRTCGPVSEFGDDSNEAPASARHKRGCNCRKSSCLKKYCKCFQSGVGCSISCRCESCKNSFGKREGVGLTTAELEKGGKAQGTHGKEEKLGFDKHHVVSQSGDLAASENLLATPSLEPYRSSFLLPSTCSKLTPATAGCSSELHNPLSPMKLDVLLSPGFRTRSAKMILGNEFSDIQEVGSSCTTSVKVVSPNKKRVVPPHIGTALSPIGGSSRKLVLKSIPSFPSLSILSPTKQSSSAYGT